MTVWQCSSDRTAGGSGPPAPSPSAPRLTILIIDDNHDYADSLRFLLEYYGDEADVALDGPSGLRLALSGRYDGIVCDIGLPGMNGYDVAKRVRSNAATSTTSMVAVTAYGSAEAARQCYAAGFNAHLVKPVSVTHILSCLGIQSPDTKA